MTNIQILNNILQDINFDADKLTRKYITEDAALITVEEINERWGCFANFRVEALEKINSRNVGTAGHGVATVAFGVDEVFDGEGEYEDDDDDEAEDNADNRGTKRVSVATIDGASVNAVVPTHYTVKQILRTVVELDNPEDYEIRVNSVREDDLYSIPEDGATISAFRPVKGNLDKRVTVATIDDETQCVVVPADYTVTQILRAAGVSADNYEIRIGGTIVRDLDQVPSDGAVISAFRPVKGNK